MLAGFANNLHVYLMFSAALFALGLLTAFSRKNAIGIFMGVELMLNAGALNFVAFQSFKKNPEGIPSWLDGHIFSLFVIILAAIEAAIALAIVLRAFAVRGDVDPDKATLLKG